MAITFYSAPVRTVSKLQLKRALDARDEQLWPALLAAVEAAGAAEDWTLAIALDPADALAEQIGDALGLDAEGRAKLFAEARRK
jgi:hypothetical protein